MTSFGAATLLRGVLNNTTKPKKKMTNKKCKYPNSRKGWSDYYAKVYDKTGREPALQLSLWYQVLHEAFGE